MPGLIWLALILTPLLLILVVRFLFLLISMMPESNDKE